MNPLKKSCKWLVRYSNNGIGYDGHKHAPIGEWAECPRWTENATCNGGGFFGQTLAHHGHHHSAPDIEIAEHDGALKVIEGNKVAVRRMRILARGQAAMDMLCDLCDGVWPGSLRVIDGIVCRLTAIGGNARIEADAQAPALTTIGGYADIRAGAQVPALTTIGGDAYILEGAQAPALTAIGGNAYIYARAQAPALTTIGGDSYILEGAQAPALTTIGGNADIYSRAQVPALTTIGGDADIYSRAQAPALTHVNGRKIK
jgi:hypothetical protein